jgi:hypothetical protein
VTYVNHNSLNEPEQGLSNLTSNDLATFQKLGITPGLLERAHIRRVTDTQAREDYGIRGNGDMTGIVFPYHLPGNDNRRTARIRRDHPDIEDGRPHKKYVAPYGDHRHLYFVPGCLDLAKDSTVPIVLVEAEKSALALTALSERMGQKLLPVAMGGCYGWRGRIGKKTAPDGNAVDEYGALEDLNICRDGRRTLVLLDTNVTTNLNVQIARRELVKQLRKQGADVRVLELPQGDWNGPDDYVAANGDHAMMAVLQGASITAESTPALIDAPRAWPEPLQEDAFYGLAGEIVRMIEPHSEADPAALLVQFLVMFGSALGPGPFCLAEATPHAGSLFVVLVGKTSAGAKGTAYDRVRSLFVDVDPEWLSNRIQSGLSSGEGLIEPIRDGDDENEGVTDKRLLVYQGEFSSVLAVTAREGNTLSMVLRDAWDGKTLGAMTRKQNAIKCTNPHISIIGHITNRELKAKLTTVDTANGFGNRFLWVCTKRSKSLPEGGHVPFELITRARQRLCQAITKARTIGEMSRSPEARKLWAEVYEGLRERPDDLVGDLTARGVAQVLRLSMLYALLDGSAVVEQCHLKAALACQAYVEASCRYIFGEASGDPMMDDMLRLLRSRPDGITRTDIYHWFGRHVSSERLGGCLQELAAKGLARMEREQTSGRPVERWFYCARSALSAISPQPHHLNALNTLNAPDDCTKVDHPEAGARIMEAL